MSLVRSDEYSTLGVAELFGVGRSTVHRAIQWAIRRGRVKGPDSLTPQHKRQSHSSPASRNRDSRGTLASNTASIRARTSKSQERFGEFWRSAQQQVADEFDRLLER